MIVRFVALAYVLAWSLWCSIPFVGHYGFRLTWLGHQANVSVASIIFVLGGLSPGIAALVVGGARPRLISLEDTRRGRQGSLFVWCSVGLVFPVLVVAISALPYLPLGAAPRTDTRAILHWLAFFLLNLPLSSFWEEYGWRGYLLPELQRRFSPLKAALIVGLVWGPWHLPKQLILTTASPGLVKTIALFMIQIILISVLLTWVFNSSGGRLLPAVLFHGSFNMSEHFLITPLMQNRGILPYAFTALVLLVAATAVLFLSRGRLGRSATTP